jgi:hypothetical protein
MDKSTRTRQVGDVSGFDGVCGGVTCDGIDNAAMNMGGFAWARELREAAG